MHSIQWHILKTQTNQGGVLSPTLFNTYTSESDIPLPPKDMQITTYTDDITITASHTKHRKAQQLIQLYFHKIYEWDTTNNLHINTEKLPPQLLHQTQLNITQLYHLN